MSVSIVDARRLTPGEALMARLGLTPAFVEDQVGAAICAMPLKQFRAICPVPPIVMGRGRRVRPIDEITNWARRRWQEQTSRVGDGGKETVVRRADEHANWTDLLPGPVAPMCAGR